MKILLVKPYAELLVAKRLEEGFLRLEPLGLEIVAGGVPQEEDVRILDLGLYKDPVRKFEETVQGFQPDIVGFSVYSSMLETVKQLSRRTKKIGPDIKIIVGGIHATIAPADFNEPFIDIVVRGEGGTAMREIVRRYKNKEPLYFNGISLAPDDPDFTVKAMSALPQYPDVCDIPRPRRDLVERARYFCVWTKTDTGRLTHLFPEVASMRTSMGCAYSCSFCVIHLLMDGKYLKREPEDVVDEIAGIQQDYIYFVDDEMFLDAMRVRRIAEIIKEKGIRKHYISWARSDTIVRHSEVFALWKEIGLDVVYVGLESVDEFRLSEYSKRTSIDTNRRAVKILEGLGIMLHAAFIVHPDFEVDDFRRLEAEVKRISPAEITFTVLSPSPGTKFWSDNKDKFICDPYRFYDCMHTILPTRLPLRRFYQHFGRLTSLALRANPLRVQHIRVPFRDFLRAIFCGTSYIFSLYSIYKDYKGLLKDELIYGKTT